MPLSQYSDNYFNINVFPLLSVFIHQDRRVLRLAQDLLFISSQPSPDKSEEAAMAKDISISQYGYPEIVQRQL